MISTFYTVLILGLEAATLGTMAMPIGSSDNAIHLYKRYADDLDQAYLLEKRQKLFSGGGSFTTPGEGEYKGGQSSAGGSPTSPTSTPYTGQGPVPPSGAQPTPPSGAYPPGAGHPVPKSPGSSSTSDYPSSSSQTPLPKKPPSSVNPSSAGQGGAGYSGGEDGDEEDPEPPSQYPPKDPSKSHPAGAKLPAVKPTPTQDDNDDESDD
ncbi:hypothetical protein BASA61_002736 [Batrachochytrium salamandrivorans]|nr:hypothetical protein BASA61_002736 [Batrachochytrium salamandrivorans]